MQQDSRPTRIYRVSAPLEELPCVGTWHLLVNVQHGLGFVTFAMESDVHVAFGFNIPRPMAWPTGKCDTAVLIELHVAVGALEPVHEEQRHRAGPRDR